ncbi:MAG: hypothetical protein ABI698_10690, partial [bacterium]
MSKKIKTDRKPKDPIATASSAIDRRSFVKLVPALGAAAVIAPHLQFSSLAQTPSPAASPLPSPSPSPTPLRVTKEMLQQTEKLIGIELTDAQEAMALQNASANLDRYEA